MNNLHDARQAASRNTNHFPKTFRVGQTFGRNSENTVTRIEESWLQAGTNFTTVYYTCPHVAYDLGRPEGYQFAVGIRKNQVA
tara:strand:+ start:690 stop:938 length:249 start_codon:yes stop_codon:yes gene_type:complete